MAQQYIIAIGASAGGLEALSSFFDHTPMDGVSYIIIPHLSADLKTRMVEILSRHTALSVIEGEEGMLVEKNKIYLIPNDKFMGIREGKLYLIDKAGQERPHFTIDIFFTSLAIERGAKAIGVVLSGVGSDGSRGICDIQKAGGVVMVQDPLDALFDGMPKAALASSKTNYVLAAEALPVAIQQYVHEDDTMGLSDQEPFNLSESFLSAVIGSIKERFPFDFTGYKIPTLIRRIRRRMAYHHLNEEDRYFNYLKEHPLEAELLIKDFLIGVTSFFRDPEAFEILESQVVPQLIDQKADGELLKIWVACCATGEEAYSLAILIKEYLNKSKKELEVKIFATDINRIALEQAAKGIFTDHIEKTVPPGRLKMFFDPVDEGYKIKPEIRNMLIFAQHDLIKNPAYCHMDFVSCRNMLIYVNPVLQKQVLAKFSFGLKTGGYLFLGSSEHISTPKDEFIEINTKCKIYQRTDIRRNLPLEGYLAPTISGMKPAQLERTTNLKAATAPALTLDLTEIILLEGGFSGVSIDEELKVTQVFGDISTFLKPERFIFHLQQLLPEPLAVAFSTAYHKLGNTVQRVKIAAISFKEPGSDIYRQADLIVNAYQDRKLRKRGMLVLFKLVNEEKLTYDIEENFDMDIHIKEYIDHLEEELSQTRQDLQSSNELLEASKESMHAFNDELLSANEEMQSANEELQSINEELETINNEHQSTIQDLTVLNDDLNNYFRSNINGQLFVDDQLCLKKFSPGAVKHINIRERDIGRPLTNITTNIKFETLIEDIKKVISTGEVIIQEVESTDGRCYQVMTSAYIRQKDNQANGAIVTFYDITELQTAQRELDNRNKTLLRINADLDNFVYAASHDLVSPINNIESVLSILTNKMDMTDPVVSQFTHILENSIKNFKSVIKDMAVIGAIEAEMRKENPSQNFELIFEEIKESISDKINAAKASFSVDFQEKEVKFPKKNLRSIIINLITNALKFKHPDRDAQILIRTEQYKECILLTVQDNGIGIAKDRLDFIFRMYQRVSEDTEGQGIGLYLINKIIDASGGRVEVESELGVGSVFKIFFKNK